ncbi:MAG: hypothetical protein ACE5FA_13665 [Dehalococcoidia bacterium]
MLRAEDAPCPTFIRPISLVVRSYVAPQSLTRVVRFLLRKWRIV